MKRTELAKVQKLLETRGEEYLPGLEPDIHVEVQRDYYSHDPVYAGSVLKLLEVNTDRKGPPLKVEGLGGEPTWIEYKTVHVTEKRLKLRYKGRTEKEHFKHEAELEKIRQTPEFYDHFGVRIRIDSQVVYYNTARKEMCHGIIKEIRVNDRGHPIFVLTDESEGKTIFQVSTNIVVIPRAQRKLGALHQAWCNGKTRDMRVARRKVRK